MEFLPIGQWKSPVAQANFVFQMRTMETIKQHTAHLHSLLLEGKLLDAFDQYYDDHVVMQENDTTPVVGKQENRQREIDFLNSITEFRGASVEAVTFSDDVVMTQWHYDYTHKDWGPRNFRQVSVQRWKDGKIVKEQFFYGN